MNVQIIKPPINTPINYYWVVRPRDLKNETEEYLVEPKINKLRIRLFYDFQRMSISYLMEGLIFFDWGSIIGVSPGFKTEDADGYWLYFNLKGDQYKTNTHSNEWLMTHPLNFFVPLTTEELVGMEYGLI